MARRLFASAGVLAAVALATSAADPADAKKGLQEVGDLVGDWKGAGDAKVGGKPALWKETLSWGWKFKGGESWIALDVKGGKFLSGGELRYDPAKKVYRLAAAEPGKPEQVYEGKLAKNGRLVLDRKDPATGDVRRLTVYTLADGARMVVQGESQTKGKGLFATEFKVSATKEGESFAGGGKKNECVVTGGLGTMAVSYAGKTYYVCCSGCRDEFNADPKKYAEAFDAKRK